jgi:gluconate kinase
MRAGMLKSQLEALEWPSDAMVIDVARPLDAVCSDVVAYIRDRVY